MPGNLLKLIERKLSNRPYDVQVYIRIIDNIIWEVYRFRYRGIETRTPSDVYGSKKGVYASRQGPDAHFAGKSRVFTESTGKKVERADFRFEGGALFVEFEAFRNSCWDQLEAPDFQRYLRDFRSLDDASLKGRIRISFENILQREIYNLSPGLETRKKQIDRVLKPLCMKSCKKWCKCWKLRSHKEEPLAPAELELLREGASGLELPQMHYPKLGSKYGPSIKDNEMKEYLVAVLDLVGGMATCNDMISLIKTQYGIETIREVIPVSTEGSDDGAFRTGPTEDQIARAFSETKYFFGAEHRLMAQELLDTLSPREKKVLYLRFSEEQTLEKIASQVGCSLSSVHNVISKIEKRFSDYFQVGTYQAATDEVQSVFEAVNRLIAREMASST